MNNIFKKNFIFKNVNSDIKYDRFFISSISTEEYTIKPFTKKGNISKKNLLIKKEELLSKYRDNQLRLIGILK